MPTDLSHIGWFSGSFLHACLISATEEGNSRAQNMAPRYLIEYCACKELLQKAMAPHSSTLAWKIPWMEEPGTLQSMGSLRVRHDWATSLSFFTFMHWRKKWQPTPVFLPGESQGRGSLVGCCLWGRTVRHDWNDLAAAAELINLKGIIKHVSNMDSLYCDLRAKTWVLVLCMVLCNKIQRWSSPPFSMKTWVLFILEDLVYELSLWSFSQPSSTIVDSHQSYYSIFHTEKHFNVHMILFPIGLITCTKYLNLT